jgi:hypothetical protein
MKTTKYSRCYFQLALSALPTGETGFGLLPTPTTAGLDGGSNSRRAWRKREQRALRGRRLKPRPTAGDRIGAKTGNGDEHRKKEGDALTEEARLWPTPRACSAMGAIITADSAWERSRFPNLETEIGRRMFPKPMAHDTNRNSPTGMSRRTLSSAGKVGGKMNPRWVSWLMGYPSDHINLGPSGTQSFQRARRGLRKG